MSSFTLTSSSWATFFLTPVACWQAPVSAQRLVLPLHCTSWADLTNPPSPPTWYLSFHFSFSLFLVLIFVMCALMNCSFHIFCHIRYTWTLPHLLHCPLPSKLFLPLHRPLVFPVHYNHSFDTAARHLPLCLQKYPCVSARGLLTPWSSSFSGHHWSPESLCTLVWLPSSLYWSSL